jgi:glyoxylase-like metal-dependent hydrolase (beta-lactamase superfamily II)
MGGTMTKHLKILALASVATVFLLQGNAASAQPAAPQKTMSQILRERGKQDVEFQKVPPVKMFDNLWYVGPGYVSCYLIKTSAGAILIDASEEPDMVAHVIDSIKKAGTDLKDVKAIFISHGHIDHWGGIDRMHELTGAPVYATEEDWKMIEDTTSRPGRGGAPAPRAPKRDKIVHDGDVFTLGDTTLKLYVTPGHTPGVMSTEFTVYDNGVPHKAFYSGGLGGRDGVKGFEDAVQSASRVAAIPGIEVYLPNHGWNPGTDYPNGSLFERFPKLAARKAGEPNPFVDPASWKQAIGEAQDRIARGLEVEKKKPAVGGGQ